MFSSNLKPEEHVYSKQNEDGSISFYACSNYEIIQRIQDNLREANYKLVEIQLIIKDIQRKLDQKEQL